MCYYNLTCHPPSVALCPQSHLFSTIAVGLFPQSHLSSTIAVVIFPKSHLSSSIAVTLHITTISPVLYHCHCAISTIWPDFTVVNYWQKSPANMAQISGTGGKRVYTIHSTHAQRTHLAGLFSVLWQNFRPVAPNQEKPFHSLIYISTYHWAKGGAPPLHPYLVTYPLWSTRLGCIHPLAAKAWLEGRGSSWNV